MKIGYICSDIDIPLFGHEGCSIHILEFTNALIELGHDVFLLCMDVGKVDRKRTKARVIDVRPRGLAALPWHALGDTEVILDNHLERDLASIFYNQWLTSAAAEILERERPDFLYERYALFGSAGVELSRRRHIPLILEVNAPLCKEQAGYEKFTLPHLAARIEKDVFRAADALSVVSQWLNDWIASLGIRPEKIHVVPNGVSQHRFAKPISAKAVRRRWGLADKRVIGYVGSFQPWHDVTGLVHAFARLHEKDRALQLLLVGEGERRGQVKDMTDRLGLASAVVFTGNVAHDQVPLLIRAMDVAVVPYGRRAARYFSPLKLFECMAVGTPTVAAAHGQIVDIIEHGKTGWLYRPGDQEQLVAGIATLLDDPPLAARMGALARQTVLREHTWQSAAGRIVNLARQLIHTSTRNGELLRGKR